jgi:nucleoside 2-deoxyribosyltransferase
MKYYLAGPFWVKECSEFFDKFIERCKETALTNQVADHLVDVPSKEELRSDVSAKNHVCDPLEDIVEVKELTMDSVFVPGHFKVDFNKVKSEYDVASFRRVLRQILDFDLKEVKDNALVAYVKGYDLGTLFELGYFLASNRSYSSAGTYARLRKKLIIEGIDDKIIESIDSIVDDNISYPSINLSDEVGGLLIFDGKKIGLDEYVDPNKSYSIAAINVDNYKDNPFNSILSGVLYRNKFPFFTYSTTGSESNVMMIASSLFHVIVENPNNLDEELGNAAFEDFTKRFWDDSYFDKFSDIK